MEDADFEFNLEENFLDEEINEISPVAVLDNNRTIYSQTVAVQEPNVFAECDEEYDALLSQINEDEFIRPPEPKRCKIIVNKKPFMTSTPLPPRPLTSTPLPPRPLTPPPLPPQSPKQRFKHSTTVIKARSRTLPQEPSFMGPPLTPNVPKTAPSGPQRASVTSREAFFANYNEAQMLSIEERLNRIQRRFPGPAGLLPCLSKNETSELSDPSSHLSQQISKMLNSSSSELYRMRNNGDLPDLKLDLTSNTDRDILRMNRGPWKELLKTLKIDSEDARAPTTLMNINWIVETLSLYPVTTRVPFLALVVQEEPQLMANRKRVRDLKRKNPSIKLMDKTGVIVAAMDKKFVEMYGPELVPGTAIAVQNTTFHRFKQRVVLTLTRKNVICITSRTRKEDEEAAKKKLKFIVPPSPQALQQSIIDSKNAPTITETNEGIRVLKFCDFLLEKVLADYQHIVTTSPKDAEEEENKQEPAPTASLYSAFNRAVVTVAKISPARPPPPIRPSFATFAPQLTHRPIASAPPPPPPVVNSPTQDEEEMSSMFGDEDDEELMMALEAVDFLMDDNTSF